MEENAALVMSGYLHDATVGRWRKMCFAAIEENPKTAGAIIMSMKTKWLQKAGLESSTAAAPATAHSTVVYTAVSRFVTHKWRMVAIAHARQILSLTVPVERRHSQT